MIIDNPSRSDNTTKQEPMEMTDGGETKQWSLFSSPTNDKPNKMLEETCETDTITQHRIPGR